jgi:hypothetical protein
MRSIKIILLFMVICLINSGNISVAQVIQGIKYNSYLQEIKTDIKLPEIAENKVLKLFSLRNCIITVTTNGVFKYLNGNWSGKPFGSGWRTGALDINEEIWLASVRSIQKEGDNKIIELPEYAQKDTILCLMWENDKSLHIGTTNGILTYDGTWEKISCTKGKRINSITKDIKGDIWLATTDGLLHRINGKWFNMDDHLMADGLKRHYFALKSRCDKDEVLFSGQLTVGCIAEDGNHWLFGGADGLPYGPVTSIHVSGNALWFGTGKGAIKKDKSWHYYNGKRWLQNNKVNDILPIDEHTVWVATPEGISQIQEVEITLDQKATAFEERIKLRHDRYGLVSASQLISTGDLSTSQTVNSDNDGLWTSIYLAAECFRYAVIKDPEARKNAIKTYEALERLETVTGIPGFPARSFAASTDSVIQSRSPHPKKWHPSPDGEWQWLDDTSSDEIVGHLFAIPLFYDLVAEGEMKERAKNLVHRIMTHIVNNNFQLIDLDGKPTKWAIWTPDSLNIIPGRWYERGINSLQILSFLKTAYHVTKDQKFEKAYKTLTQNHHYAENTIQAKMYGPYENSHSDDILTYLPYYNMFRYAEDDKLLPIFTKSLLRSWNVAQPDHIPLWNIIASTALKKDCDLKIALEELQLIPMDLINWKMENSHRWDLQQNQLTDRAGKAQAVKPIPTPEGGISKWNTNTHQYDSGANGNTEDDGAYFLLPYWMGRYHGFFIEK